jgi:hypothetical protein
MAVVAFAVAGVPRAVVEPAEISAICHPLFHLKIGQIPRKVHV